MKIAICSDLHLEFGDITLKNTKKADLLILSGDICTAAGLDRPGNLFMDFFHRCSQMFPEVIYISGNHEHYKYDFAKTMPAIKKHLSIFPNIHVLDNDTFKLNDFVFIGGTLWTDMNKEDPLTLSTVSRFMNDFKIIHNSNDMVSYKVYLPNPEEPWNKEKEVTVFKERPSLFTTTKAVEEHRKMLNYIKHVIKNNPDNKIVIVGHHAPSRKSTHPRYKYESLMNGGYSSELDQFIIDNPQIKLWTHGHTHDSFDYVIGETRIVCNPRGYHGHEARASKFKLKTIEI
jgi:Icc-related predicted phosphoesterase